MIFWSRKGATTTEIKGWHKAAVLAVLFCVGFGAATIQQIVGIGTAGSPAGGVVTVQGAASGTAIPISGTVTATISGVATEATLSTLNGKFGTIGQKAAVGSTSVVLASDQSLPLPSGAATATNQTSGGQKTQAVDASGNVHPAADVASRAAYSRITDGTNSLPTMDVIARSGQVQINDGTGILGGSARPVQCSLANTAANSTAVKVDGSAVTQPVSGTVTANQGGAPWSMSGSGSFTVAQSSASNLKAQCTGSGTAGTADTGVQTIQGIASMTPVQVSQATASSLNAAVVGTGTAGSAASGVITVQGIASMTAVKTDGSAVTQPVSIAAAAADNSSNSSSKLPVIGARANASAPTWTEGNQVPLSSDLGGLLRIYLGSWLGSTAPTVGQKADASSIPVVLSTGVVGSAGSAASGVLSIQGIANSTAVRVDGTGGSGCTYTVIQTNTTTTVRSAAGVLCFLFWQAGSVTSLAAYDNGSGGTTNQIISRDTSTANTLNREDFGAWGLKLLNGLTVVTSGGSAAFVTVGTKSSTGL